MPKKDKKEKKEKGTSIKIFARVRGLMPWEPKKVSLSVDGTTRVRNRTGKVITEYDFARVFKPDSTNEQVFKAIVMPMISNVLKGFNAVLIAYGQTGSGKTFSMLGKPRLGVVGLLPRMLAYIVDQPTVSKVELAAVEAFGHHVAKINLYDLFDPHNQVRKWDEKKGDGSIDPRSATHVEIHDADDAHDKIVYAHGASHFAPTGKNPESSRGHVTFIAKVHKQRSAHESQISYFAFLDCAGSEGESAFTDEFKSLVDAQTLMGRRLEAGTINTGLSQLQVIFNELRRKGKLTDTVGNGLRRVLHPYINTNTFISVLFALSPSVNNAKPTEATLKFAVAAGMVKVTPVLAAGKVDFETLVAELKAHIQRQEAVIEEQNDDVDDIERQMARIREAIARVKRGLPAKAPKKKGKKATGSVKISVEEVEAAYEPTGLGDVDLDFVSTKHMEAAVPDEAAQAAMMDVLDSSILELMAELDEEFRDELAKDGIVPKEEPAEEKVEAPLLAVPRGRTRGGRGRRMTAEENDEAMQAALEAAKKSSGPMSPAKRKEIALKRKEERDAILEKDLLEQQKAYEALKKRQDDLHDMAKLEDMDDEKVAEHAMELTVLLAQQEALTKGLVDSRATIVEYLEGEGREALLKFFRLRGFL
jgi:hypothetical protein